MNIEDGAPNNDRNDVISRLRSMKFLFAVALSSLPFQGNCNLRCYSRIVLDQTHVCFENGLQGEIEMKIERMR
jgi:hypothetical protein